MRNEVNVLGQKWPDDQHEWKAQAEHGSRSYGFTSGGRYGQSDADEGLKDYPGDSLAECHAAPQAAEQNELDQLEHEHDYADNHVIVEV